MYITYIQKLPLWVVVSRQTCLSRMGVGPLYNRKECYCVK